MYEWSEEQLAIRDAVRRFVDDEVRPRVELLEHGDEPPYGVIRKFYSTFGLDEIARERFAAQLRRKVAGDGAPARRGGEASAAMTLIAIIELCRCCPGIVTAMGVSTALAAGTVMKSGTPAQMERWGLDLLTFDKIGAWAITEADSGSDALGGMKATARRDGDGYVLNGNKTFITNGPYADTIVFYAKLDDGTVADPRERPVLTFVLDRGMEGLEQSKPFKKMGLHSSPTGELFLSDVRVGKDRLLGEGESEMKGAGRESAKDNFATERAGIAAMSLGVIEECLARCVEYAKNRLLWGKPIGDFELIQLKLARMEVARLNVENLVFRHIETVSVGKSLSLAEASAMKLYCAQAASEVAMDAVQLFGGNGYMSDFRVEQLARDAKVFQIYAGTDEIQVTHIARDLLSR
ncbi:MAG: acyl-CoA dehydrogenase family protein [Actinobacteria bacterium]|nr:acyl-CoA dehydrogenase family protein [Actinomycetota bacterium]MCL5445563.1 acyl-CoA dehydrogenase family protein [Actinomycetota bacterium]